MTYHYRTAERLAELEENPMAVLTVKGAKGFPLRCRSGTIKTTRGWFTVRSRGRAEPQAEISCVVTSSGI